MAVKLKDKLNAMLFGKGIATDFVNEWVDRHKIRNSDVIDAYMLLGREYVGDCIVADKSLRDREYRALWSEAFDAPEWRELFDRTPPEFSMEEKLRGEIQNNGSC